MAHGHEKYQFTVDGSLHGTGDRIMNGSQIRETAGKRPASDFVLIQIVEGSGRSIGLEGEVKFTGMVTPDVKRLEYVVDLKRVILRKLKLGIADGTLLADGKVIYSASDLRVGLFESDAAEGAGAA